MPPHRVFVEPLRAIFIMVGSCSAGAMLAASLLYFLGPGLSSFYGRLPGWRTLVHAGTGLVLPAGFRMTLTEKMIFLMLAAGLSLVVWFRLRRVSAPIAVIVSSLWITAAIAAPAYSFGLYKGHPDALPYVDGLGTWCVYRHCASIEYIGWPYAALGMQLAVAAIAAFVYVWPRQRRWLAGSMTVLFALGVLLIRSGLDRNLV